VDALSPAQVYKERSAQGNCEVDALPLDHVIKGGQTISAQFTCEVDLPLPAQVDIERSAQVTCEVGSLLLYTSACTGRYREISSAVNSEVDVRVLPPADLLNFIYSISNQPSVVLPNLVIPSL
jgi:hypothetical protein